MDADENKQKVKDGAETSSESKESPQAHPSAQLQIKRADDYESLYANNVRFESSVWDLKLLFGQLDQSTSSTETVEIHTGMSIPWTTAKLMAFYLQVNIMAHELDNGKIRVNPRVYPVEAPPLTTEFESNDVAKKVRENAMKMRGDFIKDQQG